MDTLYQLDDLAKAYEQRSILNIHKLSIYQGEILAVVGPSGAGKSTLLRLLNFLESPDSGTLTYQGYSSTSENIPLTLRREVTTVFQRPALLSTTVEKNVTYGLKLRGLKDKQTDVAQAIKRMGLEKLAKSPARTLSGGEAQRVALARAVILKPTVLLLDEPSANLDPYNVGLIEDVVREMNAQHGTTVVLVTHNIFQAKRLAHRVAFLLGGKIVEINTAEIFFNKPGDPRTRAFINGEIVY